jgi:hypothetical protein
MRKVAKVRIFLGGVILALASICLGLSLALHDFWIDTVEIWWDQRHTEGRE